jgi:hypothetical protein
MTTIPYLKMNMIEGTYFTEIFISAPRTMRAVAMALI